MDRLRGFALGYFGVAGVGFSTAGTRRWRAAMSSMELMYGLGGICAVGLLAYLVYALICAEEF
jgi:K+-transporting ATPase KdpF subunit